MTARLPTADVYTAAVHKEHQWLPVLAPTLPVQIPEAVAKGAPSQGYPYHWAVRRWIDGETASPETVPHLSGFARSIAEFILALQSCDASGGPEAGAHSFYRGAPPEYYHDETIAALDVLKGQLDTDLAREVWETALASSWDRPPVWFHGDIASGNLLVQDGRLSAVIDFGTSGVGDPACDLVIAYTFFSGTSRSVFRDTVQHDSDTWARARGWALWKALITLADDRDVEINRQVIDEVLADHLATRTP